MTMVEDMQRVEKQNQALTRAFKNLNDRLSMIEFRMKALEELCITSNVKDAAIQQKLMKNTAWTAIRKWLSFVAKGVGGK